MNDENNSGRFFGTIYDNLFWNFQENVDGISEVTLGRILGQTMGKYSVSFLEDTLLKPSVEFRKKKKNKIVGELLEELSKDILWKFSDESFEKICSYYQLQISKKFLDKSLE